MTEIKTRNGIAKGDEVVWVRDSKLVPAQNGLAKGNLKKGKIYVVEFVFPGEEFEQIELEGIPEYLFVHDMFQRIK
jgi:hypothetical protein